MSNTPIQSSPIGDVGPIGKVPRIVGICSAHGFWFEARSQRESCPESRCLAPVHFFVWRNEYRPEGEADELEMRTDVEYDESDGHA